MTTVTATEAKNHFGEIVQKAQREAIRVSTSGRDTVVIVAADEYDRLRAMEDRIWGQKALEVIKNENPLGVEASMAWLESTVLGGA